MNSMDFRVFVNRVLAIVYMGFAGVVGVVGLAGMIGQANAGQQAEEALSDSVRTALTAALKAPAPPSLVFVDDAARQRHEAWVARTRVALKSKPPTGLKRSGWNFCKPFGTKANAPACRRLW